MLDKFLLVRTFNHFSISIIGTQLLFFKSSVSFILYCRFLIQNVLNSDAMKTRYFKIRKAEKKDCITIHEYIRSLAVYEKAEDKFKISVEDLENDGFSDRPYFQAIILEEKNQPVGFALYYFRYSTWNGKNLYLEDLFIEPAHRSKGYGLEAMLFLAKLALENKCGRFEWQVLDWNKPAITFYESIGAELDSEWINCRMNHSEIQRFVTNHRDQKDT